MKLRLLESLAGHPRVHGGILAGGSKRRPIDLMAVNLHPFAKAAENAPPFSREAAESIDIGGADIIRTAAKSFRDVAIVVSPADYVPILTELARSGGQLCEETRRRLSCRAFEHTAAYDVMIAEAWSSGLSDGAEGGWETFPQRLSLRMEKVMDLRYGENPHQKAALYARQGEAPSFEQLHGNDLSYNNLLDAFGTWEAVCEFDEPAAVIFKHVTPSGLGISKTLAGALENAWLCDPVSASGGVLAFNRTVDSTAAQAVCRRSFEVLCAPGFEPDAFEILKKKPNLRLVAMKPLLRKNPTFARWEGRCWSRTRTACFWPGSGES